MEPRFFQKLEKAHNRIILHLNPKFELLPLPITRYDDPFLPFGKEIIAATSDIVAGYLFDFASYLAMGGAGAVALERSIAYVPEHCVTILHGAFTGTGYSAMADSTGFNVDAITVSTQDDLDYYTQHIPYMAFLVSETEQHVPNRGGIYAMNKLLYKRNDVVESLALTTDTILYSSKLDDFAEKVREGVLSLT